MLITKEAIENVYVKQNKSLRYAAKCFNCCTRTIVNYLDRYGIPHRKQGQMIESRRGVKFTEEHKRNLSISLKGKKPSLSPQTGKPWNYNSINVECGYCKKPVLTTPYKIKTQKNVYCNRICMGKSKVTQDYSKFDNINIQKDGVGRIKIKCSGCGEVIYKHPYRLLRSKNLFCNIKCHGKWLAENKTGKNSNTYKGGRNYYGESWGRAKILARERDSYSCKRCGKTKDEMGKNPDVHHIIPFRQFGEINHKSANNLNNLISCCSACHKILEQESNKNIIHEDYSI